MLEIHGVNFERAQHGWRCTIWFSCITHRQFTAEYHDEHEYARFWSVAFVKAYRSALDTRRALQGVQGAHNN